MYTSQVVDTLSEALAIVLARPLGILADSLGDEVRGIRTVADDRGAPRVMAVEDGRGARDAVFITTPFDTTLREALFAVAVDTVEAAPREEDEAEAILGRRPTIVPRVAFATDLVVDAAPRMSAADSGDVSSLLLLLLIDVLVCMLYLSLW